MFSIVAVAVWIILGVFLMVLRSLGGWTGDSSIAAIVFSICFGITAAIWLSVALAGNYTWQLNNFASVKASKQKISLYTERRDKLTGIVKTELAKYPEFEKQILDNIRPDILLQFPNLKSNETIVKTVEEIVKLENSVYEIRASMISTLESIYYREISPWVIYVTPYQKFFGEQNPLVGVK